MKEQKGGAISSTEVLEEKSKAQKTLEIAKEKDKNKIEVRINRTTSIFINPSECPIKARERFLKRIGTK